MVETAASKGNFNSGLESARGERNKPAAAGICATALSLAYLHPEMVAVIANLPFDLMTADLARTVREVHWVGSTPPTAEDFREAATQPNLTIHENEGATLPFPDGSVDVIFTGLNPQGGPDSGEMILSCTQILRPGGRMMILHRVSDFSLDENGLRESSGAAPPLTQPDPVRTWLQAAGLVNIQILDKTRQDEKERFFIAAGTRHISVRHAVQENYSALVQQEGCGCSDSGCCAPATGDLPQLTQVHWQTGYRPDEIKQVPVEAVNISLGCGNPIALANLRPGEVVLDIGSGGGIDAFLAARQVGETGFVIGIDMTEAMLERAQNTALNHGVENVEFRAGIAEALPVEDESIDVVLSNCVINLCEDKEQVFREAYRVIKPGGRLEINDTVFERGVLPAMRSSTTGWSECVSGALPEGEYINLVRQAGFKQVEVRRSTSSGVSAGIPFYSIQVSARK